MAPRWWERDPDYQAAKYGAAAHGPDWGWSMHNGQLVRNADWNHPQPGAPNFNGPVTPQEQQFYNAQHGQANTKPNWQQQPEYGLSEQEKAFIQAQQTKLQMNELAQFQAAALQRKKIQDQAAATKSQLDNIAKLAQSGAEGAKQAQQFLNDHGQAGLTIDGAFGQQSVAAFNKYRDTLNNQFSTQFNAAQAAMDINKIREQSNKNAEAQAVTARKTIAGAAGANIRQLDQQAAALIAGINPKNGKAYNQFIRDANKVSNNVPLLTMDQTGQYNMGFVKQLVDNGRIDQSTYDTIQKMSDQRATWTQIGAKSQDPSQMDNVGALHLEKRIIQSQIQSLQHDNMVEAHNDPMKAWADPFSAFKSIVGATFQKVQPILKEVNDDLLSRPIAAYSAAMRVKINGGNFFEAVGAGLDSLGKIQVAGHTFDNPMYGKLLDQDKLIQKSTAETMTQEARQKLVDSGDLLSLGQALTGSAPHKFIVKHPDVMFGGGTLLSWTNPVAHHLKIPGISPEGLDFGASKMRDIGSGNHDKFSGLIDIATLPAKDPTFFLMPVVHELADFTTMAGERALAAASEDAIHVAGVNALHEAAIKEGTDEALKNFATREITDAEIRKAGQDAIMAQGRRNIMGLTANGRLMSQGITEAVAQAGDAIKLSKSLPGLSPEIAARAIEAKNAADGGIHAANITAEQVIHDAIAAGEYSPKISFSRQMFNNLASNLPGEALQEGIGVGRNALRLTDRMNWLKTLGAYRGMSASVFETSAGNQMLGSLEQAAKVGGSTVKSVFADHVAQAIEGVSLHDRFWNVAQFIADHADNPFFAAAYHGIIQPYFDNPAIQLFRREAMLAGADPSVVLEHVFAQEGFEQSLRGIETAMAVMDGKLGQGALDAFNVNMAAMRTGGLYEDLVRNSAQLLAGGMNTDGSIARATLGKVVKGATAKMVQEEIGNLESEALQNHFGNILKSLGSDASENQYGKLLRDIRAVATKSDLRNMVEKQLQEIADRTGAVSDFAPKVEGNAVTKGLRVGIGKVARGLSSAVEVVPKKSMALAENSENPIYLARARGDQMDRIAAAYHLPPEVRNTLVTAAQNAQSEKDIFDAVERAIRANLSQRGFQGADAEYIMGILKDGGTFKINVMEAPMFSIDPVSGEKVTDPQTIAQFVESTSVPSDNEVASAVKQAIVDNAVDATTAQRLANQVRVIVESPGKIKLVNSTGKAIVRTASWFHNMWKFLVVTNAAHPVIGATLGFVMTPGGFNDKLFGAGMGLTLGGLNMARAAFRVSVLESRTRIFLADSSLSEFSLDGWSKAKTARYGEDVTRRIMSGDAVRIGDTQADAWFNNQILSHTDPGWEIIDSNHARAPEAWWRIHNYQIHPESDPVMAIVLRENAGQLGGERKVVTLVQANAEDVAAKEAAAAAPAAEAAPSLGNSATGWSEANQLPTVNPLGVTPETVVDVAPHDVEVPLDRVVALQGHVDPEAVRAIAEKGPIDSELGTASAVTVWDAGDGNFVLENGNHRAAAAMLRGDTTIKATVNSKVVGEELANSVKSAIEERAGAAGATAAEEAPQEFKRVVKTVTETAREAADKQFNEFLQTEEGKLWKKRWQRIGVKPKEAIQRYRDFVERYSTPELSAQRVGGGYNGTPQQIDRETFERMVKNGEGPESFHVQQTWKMPRNFKDIYRSYKKIALEGTLSGPDNALNRRPWHNKLFGNEYDRLVRNGVSPERAQMLADDYATNRVNTVLHRYDEPTRLSAKLDPFMPFQHARMDLFRVYGKLLLEDPARTFNVGRYVAKAFQGGAKAGIFTQNPITHQWQLTIPGSGRLSQALFGTPMQVPFTLNIKDAFFVTSGAYGISIIPQPGGPFWSVFSRELAKHYPEVFQGDSAITKWLFPYGPTGNLLKSDTSRLWMAFTGTTPPWEFENQAGQKNQLNMWGDEVAKELIYQHRLKGDMNYLPSQKEVEDGVMHLMKAWSFFQTAPGSTYPTLTTKDKYEAAVSQFTLGGILDFNDPQVRQDFLRKYPEFEPYTYGDHKYVGPDDLNTLKKLGVGTPYNNYSKFNPETGMWESQDGQNTQAQSDGYALGKKLDYYQTLNWKDFKQVIVDNRRTNEYFTKLRNAENITNPIEREQAIAQVNKDYADVAGKYRREQDILGDLLKVTGQYPRGQIQADALQRIKTQYGLTNAELIKFQNKLKNSDAEKVVRDRAWADARDAAAINQDVESRFGTQVGSDWKKAAYVATLPPAEQLKYWQYKMDYAGTDYQYEDPKSVMDQWYAYEKQYFTVKDANPQLFAQKEIPPEVAQWQQHMKDIQDNKKTQLDAAYSQLDTLKSEMDNAAKAKNWKAYQALKDQKANTEALISVINDSLYKEYPDLTKYYTDLHAATVLDALGNKDKAAQMRQQAEMDRAAAPMWHGGEEARFLRMSPAVQEAFMGDIVNHLDQPGDKSMPPDLAAYLKDKYGVKKLYWEWLTAFQQDLIAKNFPQYVEKWQYESDHDLHGAGNTSKFKSGIGELDVVMTLLRQYDKRKGDAPAAYQQFLSLPQNAGVKRQFLDSHPEVAQWIQNGPLANMPTLYRELAMGTLLKYSNNAVGSGKFYGRGGSHFNPNAFAQSGNFQGVKFSKLPINLQWAIEQMKVWSRRSGNAPAAYDTWVNMPSGVDKATFLQQHPEVQNWIKEGPMANMPDDYKNVVRDIMFRYHEWTARQDPLGQTIAQYFATPGYGRDQFMLNHPELEVYFATTRSPQENAMFDLQNQYFQIQDVQARRAFLEAHPELQQHFVQSRTDRYERFLNQVAVYMGANPEMFQGYLDRQNDILSELLKKFAEPGLIREANPSLVNTNPTGETGRSRRPRAA